MKKWIFALAALSLSALACSKKDKTSAGDSSDVQLTLDAGISLDWSGSPEALVNDKICKIRVVDGMPVVGADRSSDGSYHIVIPARAYSRYRSSLVLPPAQFPGSGGLSSAASMPMTGKARIDGNDGRISLKPLAALLKVPVKNAGAIRSLRVRDLSGKTLSGTFLLKSGALTVDMSAPELDWVVLNTAGSGEGLTASSVVVTLPAGSYPLGLEVRVSTTDRKSCTVTTPAVTLTDGETTMAPEVDFSTVSDILYAEHFDNCVWGGDPIGGKDGYGPEPGKEKTASLTVKGKEYAYYPKNADTPGTAFFKTAAWNTRTWAVDKALVGNLGVDDWAEIYYICGYQGYIGGNPAAGYDNRPILHFTATLDIPRPKVVELSFRICGEPGFNCGLQAYSSSAELLSATIDGQVIDVDPKTSSDISMENSIWHKLLTLTSSRLADGKWHDVSLRFGGFGAWCTMRLVSDVVRNVKNCFFVDDIVVKAVDNEANRYADCAETVFPTDVRGQAGADVTHLRLTPSYCTSCNNSHIYSICPVNGMVYMCGGLPSDEEEWDRVVREGLGYLEQYGNKGRLWSSHLPYGARGTERNRDLCVPDQDLHDKTVAFFKRAIAAIAPLRPVNVLIHCNQTLLFNDGSSADWMVKSLVEIVPAADAIGAHLVVENMSYGVGASAAVLADCIDRANALAKPKYEIRICMDTGHANLYLNTVKNEGTIVDWASTAGTRIGHLHINGNRGIPNVVRANSITVCDDHLFPGYEGYCSDARGFYYDKIGRDNLWGPFYHTLVHDCQYRGPFNYEIATHDFEAMGERRSDHACCPWSVAYNYDTYVYPAYKSYLGK